MASDIHITRSSDWQETDGCEIRAEEWAAEIAEDPELELDEANGPLAAIWVGHPDGSRESWLDWSDGNVYTTEPDDALLQKMAQIAARLQARLVDDENRECARVEDVAQ